MKLTGRANESGKIPHVSIENHLLLTQHFFWEFPSSTLKILFTDIRALVRQANHESTVKEHGEPQT